MEEYKIYPKQFKNLKIPVEKNRCFMLMPFNEKFDYIYGVIKKDLNDNGFICNRADEIAGSKPILNKILTEILKSRYIIADLTDYNPNVFYELGIAHTFKDSPNILLLKQKDSKIPFDLTHLTYIEYDSSNLRFLTATIKNFIKESKYISDFHEILDIKGIIDVVSENKEFFVDYLQISLGTDISMITNLFERNFNNYYSEDEIDQFLLRYEKIIIRVLGEKHLEIVPGILKIYYELLVECSRYNITEIYINRFINEVLSILDINDDLIISWKTDLMLTLAKRKTMMKICMPWIINYFSRSKSTNIDLNRYKLESFLITNTSDEIDQIIASSIFNPNPFIREHMADIIGEKRLFTASDNLCKQLFIEENYYTARSIIQAISKINIKDGLFYLTTWLNENENKIIENHHFSIFRHLYISIARMDTSPNKEYLEKFKNKYKQYLENYIVS